MEHQLIERPLVSRKAPIGLGDRQQRLVLTSGGLLERVGDLAEAFDRDCEEQIGLPTGELLIERGRSEPDAGSDRPHRHGIPPRVGRKSTCLAKDRLASIG